MNSNNIHSLFKALAFAADRHRFQTRKDSAGTPYINHPINVALTLIETGGETDPDLLVAAVLHDTIEDTETTAEEIGQTFGPNVLALVLEVTDDKSLPKEQRKRLQVEQAPKKSSKARKLKLADKICNVYDIIHHPPDSWSAERKLNYLRWTEDVLNGLRGTDLRLEEKLERNIREGRSLLTSQKV